MLEPLRGHPAHLKCLDGPVARETLKQLARHGETLVVSDEGVALLMVRLAGVLSERSDDPSGLWDRRYWVAAAISELTGAVAVVVSGDSVVCVFEGGRLVREIDPMLHERRSS